MRGILRVNADSTTVDLSHLYWMESPEYRHQVRQYFQQQGYAEAQRLPYEQHEGSLIVSLPSADAKALGWHEAVDADGIPF